MWDYKLIKKHDEVRNFAIKAELTNQNWHNVAMKDRFHLTWRKLAGQNMYFLCFPWFPWKQQLKNFHRLIYLQKHWEISGVIVFNFFHFYQRHSSFSINRSFCQICQNCIRSEKNSAKNLPLTGLEPSTLGLTLLLTSCAWPLC